jgi:hypothetical protein
MNTPTSEQLEDIEYWKEQLEPGQSTVVWNLVRIYTRHSFSDVRTIVRAYHDFLELTEKDIQALVKRMGELDIRLQQIDVYMSKAADVLPKLTRLIDHVALLETDGQYAVIDRARTNRRLNSLEEPETPTE